MHETFRSTDRTAGRNAGTGWLLAALSALAGCQRAPLPGGGQASARLKHARVVVICATPDDPRWPAIRAGLTRSLGAYDGLRIEWRSLQTPSPAKLTTMLHTLRRNQPSPDAVVIYWPARLEAPPLPETFSPDRQIVVVIGPQQAPPGVYGLVRVAWAAGAETLAARLHELPGKPQSLLLLHGAACGPWGQRLRDRFLLALRKAGRVVVLDQAETCGATPPRQTVAALTQRFPHAGVLVSLRRELWDMPGVLEALRPQMRIATLGADPQLWPLLRSGRLTALVGPVDGQIGQAAGELVISGLADGLPGPHVRTIECDLIEAATLRAFQRRYTHAAASQPAP